jgi:hypothetical protein
MGNEMLKKAARFFPSLMLMARTCTKQKGTENENDLCDMSYLLFPVYGVSYGT